MTWIFESPRPGFPPGGTILEPMTREKMVAEFGAPGVENPTMLDLITVDPTTDMVVLEMVERRAWQIGDSSALVSLCQAPLIPVS